MALRCVSLIALFLFAYTHASENCQEGGDSCGNDESSLLQTISMEETEQASMKVESRVPETRIAHQHQKTENEKKVDSVDAGLLGDSDPRGYKVDDPVVYYPAEYVLPEICDSHPECKKYGSPMAVGNSNNMDAELHKLGIDFDGIWWMSDNPVEEELVSFANTTVKYGSVHGEFPVTLQVPNSKKGMWSWLTTAMGQVLRRYYATADPNAHTDFVFESATKGKITTGLTDVPFVWVKEFPFYKYTTDCHLTSGNKSFCDPTDCAERLNKWKIQNREDWTCEELITTYPNDMWSRPTVFQEGSLFKDTTYTLKRIVLGDGSPHPVFWDEFKYWMTDVKEDCTWDWGDFWWKCTETRLTPGQKEMQSYMSDTGRSILR